MRRVFLIQLQAQVAQVVVVQVAQMQLVLLAQLTQVAAAVAAATLIPAEFNTTAAQAVQEL